MNQTPSPATLKAHQNFQAPPPAFSSGKVNLTLWRDVSGNNKVQKTMLWPALPALLRDAPRREHKSDCPLIKLATFGNKLSPKGSLRHDANVLEVHGIEGDYDSGEIGIHEARIRLENHRLRAVLYPSFSSTPDKPRWRVLAPLSKPVAPQERLRLVEALNGTLGGILATESSNLSQSYFYGWPLGVDPQVLVTFDDPEDGICIDDLNHLDELRIPFAGKAEGDADHQHHGDYLAELLEGADVHANALRLVGRMVQIGFSDDIIRATFAALAEEVGKARGRQRAEELTGSELDRMIAGARAKGYAPPPPVDFQEILIKKDNAGGWPDPQPLTAKLDPEPYPLDALPESIRAAVSEVASFVKAPVSLVASSCLGALSLSCQAHVDVKRLERLSGPTGLFILVIADSGERKSTCDNFFTKTVTEYEEVQYEAAKPAIKNHKAASEAWEARRQGIKEKIRQLAKEQKQTSGMESALRDLEHDKPEPPRIPRLLYADATPEALAYGLAKQWPSGGVVSAEAGIVFGSHGMGKDSIMRNLGLLNQLWDGKTLTIDRRSTESFTVRGARLTVALQVQEPTLREFFTRAGALARGSGFLARFLVAWPDSTQGMRQIDPDAPDGPATWPHLAAFHRRLAAILDQPVPIDDDGALTPALLALAPDAKAAWVDYHNDIESELASGGELYDVRDVASKSADNAARLAALFQTFEGTGGSISLAAFEGASLITAWHLHEARRFFGELALPAELADAARLDTWLIDYCRRERTHLVGKSLALQYGPLRKKESLDAAIRELEERDRLQVRKDGKRIMLAINPNLPDFANAKAANPANDGEVLA